jgi:hypothetical protein
LGTKPVIVMNNRVNAQAYYGDPVTGRRQTAVQAVSVQAGGMPFEEEQPVVAEPTAAKGRKAKSKGV